MKQFMLATAIILSVGAVLIFNGQVENVQEVNSSYKIDFSEETEAQLLADPLLLPADLGQFIEEETANATKQTEILPATLDYIFDAKFEKDGYIVEIYREYEIYQNANGDVIKEVPTSNFEFIRYKE
ncbi:MAG: hypothetical protein ACQEUT_11825 [Bacillota bacterium]